MTNLPTPTVNLAQLVTSDAVVTTGTNQGFSWLAFILGLGIGGGIAWYFTDLATRKHLSEFKQQLSVLKQQKPDPSKKAEKKK